MMEYAMLVGHEVVPCSREDSLRGRRGADELRRVAADTVGGLWVSTVFLNMNHGYTEGSPKWFETMVFPSKDDLQEQFCDRYATWDAAVAGHARVVEAIRKTGAPPLDDSAAQSESEV